MSATRSKVNDLNELPHTRQYLHRINAEVRSLRTAVVRQTEGRYWRDLALIRFERSGTVTAPGEYLPTELEAADIAAEFATVDWPRPLPLSNPQLSSSLPPEITLAQPEDVFYFHDSENRVVLIQVRVVHRDGEKAYIPFTHWDDSQWRKMEPEGPLPLWGAEQLQQHTTVFVHEGAKAARAMRDMVAAQTPAMRQKLAEHPWGQSLCYAAHVGWIGGALSPNRTDWAALQQAGVTKVYIVSDNDQPGKDAVPKIAFHLKIATWHVQFTNEWPASFDLADTWPKHMFSELDGERNYTGPAFADCIHPATWATDLVQPMVNGKPVAGRPGAVLRECFRHQWSYVEEADIFVCNDMPAMLRDEQTLNKQLAPYSHSADTSKLILKTFNGRTVRLAYRPDMAGHVITDHNTAAINLHVKSSHEPKAGDPSPFLAFMAYMFPVERERHEALRWCATLIARPGTRMHYGMLLVSESQGIGKTTLAGKVLAPLVGLHNTSWPSENDISRSEFNGWLTRKRLIVVNEIYTGHSWKAYNMLKSVVADMEVQVNEKYQRPYIIDNWAHVVACSNSPRALRVEQDDRRWFYPLLAEVPWPRARFAALRAWLAAGGLRVVLHWAQGFGDYVQSGERAPLTPRKRELIASSRSEGATEAAALGEALAALDRPMVLATEDIKAHVRASVQGKVFESDHELRKAMVEVGCYMYPGRVKLNGRRQYVVMNMLAKQMLPGENSADGEVAAALRPLFGKTSDVFEAVM